MTINDIFRQFGSEYKRQHPELSIPTLKVISSISDCRTDVLGGRKEQCNACGHTLIYYNSCRNRHCPQCQFMKKEQWIQNRNAEILPFQYFHAVFTLPHDLNPIVLRNKRIMYKLLFNAVKETLLSVTGQEKYFGARIGFFSILHTWGQKLNLHPHIHCVIPGGGFSTIKNKWVRAKQNYLVPVDVLIKRFRSTFLTELKKLYRGHELFLSGCPLEHPQKFQTLVDTLFNTDWVVYLKETFESSSKVIEYLARYTHRIAISNCRIVQCENGKVTFTWRDYADGNKKKLMTLGVMEFMKRFLLHVVPKRFVRIRYYGILSNRNKKAEISRCLEYYGITIAIEKTDKTWADLYLEVTGTDVRICPKCREGTMIVTEVIPGKRGSPEIAA